MLIVAAMVATMPPAVTAQESAAAPKVEEIKLSETQSLEQENIRLLARVMQLEEQLNTAIKAMRGQEVNRRVTEFMQRIEKDYAGKYVVDPSTLDVKPEPEPPQKK